jgi:hypothetical protein
MRQVDGELLGFQRQALGERRLAIAGCGLGGGCGLACARMLSLLPRRHRAQLLNELLPCLFILKQRGQRGIRCGGDSLVLAGISRLLVMRLLILGCLIRFLRGALLRRWRCCGLRPVVGGLHLLGICGGLGRCRLPDCGEHAQQREYQCHQACAHAQRV